MYNLDMLNDYGLNPNNPTVQMMRAVEPARSSFPNSIGNYGNWNNSNPYCQYEQTNPIQGSFMPVPVTNSYTNGGYGSVQSFNPYMNNNPYAGYYDNQNTQVQQEETYEATRLQQMYQAGRIGIGEFATYANAGLEYTTEAGTTLFARPTQTTYDAWGSPMFGYTDQEYIRRQQEQQKLAEENCKAFELARRVHRRYMGIDEEEYAKETVQKAQYEQSVVTRLMQEAELEYAYDSFVAPLKDAVYSDQKEYLSPIKENVLRHFNKVWDEKHKSFDPDHSFNDFMNSGVYADIVIDDLCYQDKKRKQNLVRLYDDLFARNTISNFAPFYDPRTATSYKGFKINKNEVEISVPPALVQQEYQQRKKVFFDTIMNNNRDNVPDTNDYLDKRYATPPPVKITQQLQL